MSAPVPSSVPVALDPAPATAVVMRSNASALRSIRCTRRGSSAVRPRAFFIVRAASARPASMDAERAASVRDSDLEVRQRLA